MPGAARRRDSREQPRAPLTTERRACGFTTVSRSTFPPRAAPPCHVRVSSPLPRPSTLGLAPSWSSLRRQAALSLTRSSPCWSSTRPTHRRRTVCPAADGTPVGETRPVWLASAVRAASALAEAGRSSGQPGARPGADRSSGPPVFHMPARRRPAPRLLLCRCLRFVDVGPLGR